MRCGQPAIEQVAGVGSRTRLRGAVRGPRRVPLPPGRASGAGRGQRCTHLPEDLGSPRTTECKPGRDFREVLESIEPPGLAGARSSRNSMCW